MWFIGIDYKLTLASMLPNLQCSQEQVIRKSVSTILSDHTTLFRVDDLEFCSGLVRRGNYTNLGEDGHMRECRKGCVGQEWKTQ